MKIHLRIVGGSILRRTSVVTWPAVPRVGDTIMSEDEHNIWTVREVVWTIGDPVPYVILH